MSISAALSRSRIKRNLTKHFILFFFSEEQRLILQLCVAALNVILNIKSLKMAQFRAETCRCFRYITCPIKIVVLRVVLILLSNAFGLH